MIGESSGVDGATADNKLAATIDDLQCRLADNDEEKEMSEEKEDEEEDVTLPAENKIKITHEFVASLADMKAFAVSKGCSALWESCMEMEDKVEPEFFKLHKHVNRRHSWTTSRLTSG